MNETEQHHVADENVDTTLDNWREQLEKSSFNSQTADSDQDLAFNNCALEGTVLPFSDLYGPQSTNHERNIPSPNVACLNDDQRRCYDIVDRHLQDTLDGKSPPQLLMFIPGEGGVGKSKVIRSMTENFEHREVGHWWVKGAYTGIAASLIDGKTLHVLAGIPVRGGRQSAHTLKKLRDFWRSKHYFIIDEVSMLSRKFFATLSRIISTAMEKGNDNIFGGLNVILVGDFHQFPPVVASQSAPLYWPANAGRDSEDDILGRKIFEQFLTVVQLKRQIRIRDMEWNDVLGHVRRGNCRQRHIDIIKKLIITNPACPPTDFSKAPWKDARLITPRHAVRAQWNSAAIKKYCAESGRRLYIAPAEDLIDGRPVTNDEKIAIMTRKKGSKSLMDRGGLMKDIELAIGAPVMVTVNIQTDLDLANGVRGTVEGIVLDEREHVMSCKEEHIIHLRYPPRYILVKLDRTKAPILEGLPSNVIPIVPVKRTFTIERKGVKTTVNRI